MHTGRPESRLRVGLSRPWTVVPSGQSVIRAGRRRVERVENAALGLPAHERQRRSSERQVSRSAARRPLEQPRHQCETRCRIVAHGRDPRLSRGERACVVAHRSSSTRIVNRSVCKMLTVAVFSLVIGRLDAM